MNLLLLLLMVLFTALVALISYKRGIIWTLVRFFFLCVTSMIAYMLAEPLAKTLLVKFLGDSSTQSVPEVIAQIISGTDMVELTPALKIPASGLALSFATPFAFVILFAIGIPVSLFLYCLAKAIIKKFCGAIIIREIPLIHKIAGAFIGAFVGIYSFAVLLSPVIVPVHAIDDTNKADMLFKLARHLTEVNDSKNESTEISHTIDTVESIYTTILHSPVLGIINSTGSYAFSEKIYDEISIISRLELSESTSLPENYSILATIREIVPLARDIDDFLDTLDRNTNYLSLPVISDAEVVFNKAVDISFLSSEEKLILVNYTTDRINDEIDKLEYSEYIDRLEKYSSFDTFKQNLSAYFELLKYICTVDIDELISEYLAY